MGLIRHKQGISLWELLVVVGIIAALVAVASPGFSATRRNAVLTSAVNQMVGTVHFARSTSILANLPAVVCLSADGIQCVGSPGESARGWLIFHDTERTSPPRKDAGDPLLRRVDLPMDVSVRGSRTALTFWPTSRTGTSVTFTFCNLHRDGPRSSRAVIVSQTGRPRVAPSSTVGCAP